MAQGSIYYALGRLSVLQKNALDQGRIERLIQADGPEEALRALGDIGWSQDADFEKMAQEHVKSAVELVKKLTTDDALVRCFLMRYDVSNIKILLKARCLGQETEELSPCGTLAQDALRHAVAEHQYAALPPILREALDRLEKRLAVEVSPLEIDLTLDRALYDWIFATLPKGEVTARAYFTAKADVTNLMIALRTLHMGKGAGFLKDMLLGVGSVSPALWLKTFEKPEKLPLLVNKYGVRVYHAAIAAQLEPGKLPQLEKAMDDYLLSLYRPFKRELDKAERIVGYLLMRQREAAAVRLVMAGKQNGFPADVIRERLRELYG